MHMYITYPEPRQLPFSSTWASLSMQKIRKKNMKLHWLKKGEKEK